MQEFSEELTYGAAICFIPEFFGIKFPKIFGDFLKKARGGFFDPLEGMWDHFKSFEHRLDSLTTPPASLCSPKGPQKPWIPEIFGETTLNFWKSHISAPTCDMGYHRNRLDLPVKIFLIYFHFQPHPSPQDPSEGSRWPPNGLPKGSFLESIQNLGYGVSSELYRLACQNDLIYFHFQPHLSPQDPSKGSRRPPNGLPKGSFLESNQNLGYGVSSESSQLARQNFSFIFIFDLTCLPRTPPKGPGGLPTASQKGHF